jgi:hypothetical protein
MTDVAGPLDVWLASALFDGSSEAAAETPEIVSKSRRVTGLMPGRLSCVDSPILGAARLGIPNPS